MSGLCLFPALAEVAVCINLSDYQKNNPLSLGSCAPYVARLGTLGWPQGHLLSPLSSSAMGQVMLICP